MIQSAVLTAEAITFILLLQCHISPHILSLLHVNQKLRKKNLFLFQFVRESIVRMPEEVFSKWFQAKVAPLSARIPSPSNSLAD